MNKRLDRFIEYCRKNNIDEAIILSIPFVGASLHAYLFAGKKEQATENLKADIIKAMKSHYDEVIKRFDQIMGFSIAKTKNVICIGSGVIENVTIIEGKFKLREKNTGETFELYGGSGINYAMRLLSIGHNAFPILPIGKDRWGQLIQEMLHSNASKSNVSRDLLDYIKSDDLFSDKTATSKSQIMVTEGTERTIVTSKAKGKEFFIDKIKNNLSLIDRKLNGGIGAVLIGHIYSDYIKNNHQSNGECTKHVVNFFKVKEIPIFANLGKSQYKLGIKFWKDYLKNIDVLQLNCSEIKELFKKMRSKKSLLDIVGWLKKENVTTVVTLDKFGAIATYKDGKDGIIIAWPIKNINIVDPTGAGDAFAAGMASELCGRKHFSFHEFYRAVGVGRTWAAYACTTIGASGNCPNQNDLDTFHEVIHKRKVIPVEIKDWREAERFIDIFDDASK